VTVPNPKNVQIHVTSGLNAIFLKFIFHKLLRNSVCSNSATLTEQLLTLQTLTYFNTLQVFY